MARVISDSPDFNTAGLRVVARVDFIEFEFETKRLTNFPTIRRKTGLPYVEALDAGPGGAARRFKARHHDSERYADLLRVVRVIDEEFGLAAEMVPTLIELALDFHQQDATRESLAGLVAHLYRHMGFVASTNHRLYGARRGMVEAIDRRQSAVARRVAQGYQIAIGNTLDALYQHLYLKDHDRKTMLPAAEHRARHEIRVDAKRLGITCLSDLQDFPFTQLAKFFSYRVFAFEASTLMGCVLAARAQPGRRRIAGELKRGRKLYGRQTRADRALNGCVYEALRELTGRWRRLPRGGSRRSSGYSKSPTTQNCLVAEAGPNNYTNTTKQRAHPLLNCNQRIPLESRHPKKRAGKREIQRVMSVLFRNKVAGLRLRPHRGCPCFLRPALRETKPCISFARAPPCAKRVQYWQSPCTPHGALQKSGAGAPFQKAFIDFLQAFLSADSTTVTNGVRATQPIDTSPIIRMQHVLRLKESVS